METRANEGNLPDPKCILVVDDDVDHHAILRVLLGHYGYSTVHAATLDDARAVLAADPVDLVILDIRLQGEHGLDLLFGMAVEGLKVPVLVCTSDARAEFTYPRAAKAAAAWMVKPVKFDELVQTVLRIVGSGQA